MTAIYKLSWLTIITGLLLPVSQLQAAGSTRQDILFTATFYGGGCDITAPATVTFNQGIVPQADIPGEQQRSDVMLNLSNCQGYFMTPSITITGETQPINGKTLFVNSSSTTTGYGILLTTAGNTAFSTNSNLASDKVITTKTWPVNGSDSVASLNGDLLLNAILSCGSCLPATSLRGGVLTSNLTFTFMYN